VVARSASENAERGLKRWQMLQPLRAAEQAPEANRRGVFGL
jgi:hypothetical protein